MIDAHEARDIAREVVREEMRAQLSTLASEVRAWIPPTLTVATGTLEAYDADGYAIVRLDGDEATEPERAGHAQVLLPAPLEGERVEVLFTPDGRAVVLGALFVDEAVVQAPDSAGISTVADVVTVLVDRGLLT